MPILSRLCLKRDHCVIENPWRSMERQCALTGSCVIQGEEEEESERENQEKRKYYSSFVVFGVYELPFEYVVFL